MLRFYSLSSACLATALSVCRATTTLDSVAVTQQHDCRDTQLQSDPEAPHGIETGAEPDYEYTSPEQDTVYLSLQLVAYVRLRETRRGHTSCKLNNDHLTDPSPPAVTSATRSPPHDTNDAHVTKDSWPKQ